MDVLSEKMVNSVLDVVKAKKIDIKSALDVIGLCMEFIDNKGLTGPEKASMVIDTLNTILSERKTDFEGLLPAVVFTEIKILADSNLVVPTLTIICNASKGRLQINKISSCCGLFHVQHT